MSQELLGKDPGFDPVCSLLWFKISQTLSYVILVSIRMFVDSDLFIMLRLYSVKQMDD